jgi:hypothetical protein
MATVAPHPAVLSAAVLHDRMIQHGACMPVTVNFGSLIVAARRGNADVGGAR